MDRPASERADFPELKDPSIIEVNPNDSAAPYRFLMYTSAGHSEGQSGGRTWKVARFGANDMQGQWRELPSPLLENLSGPQLCAPAIAYDFAGGKPRYTMYIQTACFEPGGVIMEARSDDGMHFEGRPAPLVTKNSVRRPRAPLLGVYDPSYSQVDVGGRMHDCLTFTGITHIDKDTPHHAQGDIYLMLRDRSRPDARWSEPALALSMASIPFHNQPGDAAHDYEWCPEGTQIIGLDATHFLMIGVCFLPMPAGHDGERQRVFLAAASSVDGPFLPMGVPFEPINAKGENGHPDTVIDRRTGKLHVILQERDGDKKPWGLRQGVIDIERLKAEMDSTFKAEAARAAQPPSPSISGEDPVWVARAFGRRLAESARGNG